jgi:hypothetical protein
MYILQTEIQSSFQPSFLSNGKVISKKEISETTLYCCGTYLRLQIDTKDIYFVDDHSR